MKLNEIFKENKPIIGMIHLAGETCEEKVARALEELAIYENENVDGAIVEDYHADASDVQEVLKKSQNRFNKIVIGVNLLSNPYFGFVFANTYDAKFVQFDSVQTRDLNLIHYNNLRKMFPTIAVLGGVGFKYISPTGNPLEVDLNESRSRCEAIVTTGEGTGIETPLDKLKEYKQLLGEFPLIVGAGVNQYNILEQLKVADGAIIGSYFKPHGNTQLPVDPSRVRTLMNIVKEYRSI